MTLHLVSIVMKTLRRQPASASALKEDACFSLRFDDDVDIDVPCGQHQLMPDPNRCNSYEPPQPERECPLSGLPCSPVSLWH